MTAVAGPVASAIAIQNVWKGPARAVKKHVLGRYVEMMVVVGHAGPVRIHIFASKAPANAKFFVRVCSVVTTVVADRAVHVRREKPVIMAPASVSRLAMPLNVALMGVAVFAAPAPIPTYVQMELVSAHQAAKGRHVDLMGVEGLAGSVPVVRAMTPPFAALTVSA
jgi:hypothetical protein